MVHSTKETMRANYRLVFKMAPLNPIPPKAQSFPSAEVNPKEYLGVGADIAVPTTVHDIAFRSNMNISLR